MLNWQLYLLSFLVIFGFAILGWLVSLARKNVTHVDSMWSLFFALFALFIAANAPELTVRGSILLLLVSLWSVRLCVYLTWRNWGPHEDHRYAQIRQNNQPHFWLKSVYIIFGLQAVLAWIISISLFGGLTSQAPINVLDYVGICLVLLGLGWETLADWQLSSFKANSSNHGKVLNTGLWRYSRHPNYFGECSIWWGFYLIAVAAGAWWAFISPILITLLLIKVSGVSMLESTIVERRPAYAQYIKNTSAFVPWLPKSEH